MTNIYKNLALMLVLGTCLLLLACGKKAETKDKGVTDRTQPGQTDMDAYLSKQDVNCEPNQACPKYIAKIVVINRADKSYKFCTGFLTDENIIATSASCLHHGLTTSPGLDCSRDVFVFFPKTSNRPAERVGCSKVLQVSHIEEKDPNLWRDDVSLLELAHPVKNRSKATISRSGVENNKPFTVWMIDQQGDYSAIVKKVTCESVHQNYVNPLILNESSPNMIFANCPFSVGASGAPILDSKGKVRAMVSVNISSKIREYILKSGLLINDLKEMFHATNFACAPFLDDNEMLDEKECLKDLTYQKIDRLRSEMLSTNLLFSDLKKKLEQSLEKVSKYVQFGVKLIPNDDYQHTEIYPKCFKPLDNWLHTMPNQNVYVSEAILPVKSFRRSMDSVGRVQGTVIDKPEVKYQVQFSLKRLRSEKLSYVMTWIYGVDGSRLDFPNLSQECVTPSLL